MQLARESLTKGESHFYYIRYLHVPDAPRGGQMQRAALGRAIIRQPKVFLMDELLSNLDAKLRVQMQAELKRLQ